MCVFLLLLVCVCCSLVCHKIRTFTFEFAVFRGIHIFRNAYFPCYFCLQSLVHVFISCFFFFISLHLWNTYLSGRYAFQKRIKKNYNKKFTTDPYERLASSCGQVSIHYVRLLERFGSRKTVSLNRTCRHSLPLYSCVDVISNSRTPETKPTTFIQHHWGVQGILYTFISCKFFKDKKQTLYRQNLPPKISTQKAERGKIPFIKNMFIAK